MAMMLRLLYFIVLTKLVSANKRTICFYSYMISLISVYYVSFCILENCVPGAIRKTSVLINQQCQVCSVQLVHASTKLLSRLLEMHSSFIHTMQFIYSSRNFTGSTPTTKQVGFSPSPDRYIDQFSSVFHPVKTSLFSANFSRSLTLSPAFSG